MYHVLGKSCLVQSNKYNIIRYLTHVVITGIHHNTLLCGSLYDTSDLSLVGLPAEFKHIIKRRKRN